MAFDPMSPQAPPDAPTRVLRAVLDVISCDQAWDSEMLFEVIAEAMRPKLESDRQLLQGDGPLTFEQFKGLMQRVQGWKGEWLIEHLAICEMATRRGLQWRRSPRQALEDVLDRCAERLGTALIRVPVRHIDGEVHAVDVGAWTIGLTPAQFDEVHVQEVRAR